MTTLYQICSETSGFKSLENQEIVQLPPLLLNFYFVSNFFFAMRFRIEKITRTVLHGKSADLCCQSGIASGIKVNA